MDNKILELANKEFKRIIAPLTPSFDGYRKHPTHNDVIIGHWHEDGNEFEIKCPPQLRDCLYEILTSLNNLEIKEQ